MTETDRIELIKSILDVADDEHFDRVARINAPFVLAGGESLYGPNGYRNPRLLDGANIVRAYLVDLARDQGVEIRGAK